MDQKRILITGGAGFIGSHLVDQALARGAQVLCLDAMTYAAHLENLSSALNNEQFRFVQGRVEDAGRLAELFMEFKPTGVVHAAAETHVDRSITDPRVFFETNTRGSFELLVRSHSYWQGLSGVEKDRFRFIQISTDEVFGEMTETGSASETSPMNPRSPYSASKAASDMFAKAFFHTYGFPAIVTHCSNNYGPRQFHEKLIPRMIAVALKGERLPIYGTGKNIRDWIHVEDHSNGVWLALERGVPGETYCFGGGSEHTNLEVVEMLCEILNSLAPRKTRYQDLISFVADRPGHDFRYSIDDSKAQNALGFGKSNRSFRSRLEDTVKWYLDFWSSRPNKAYSPEAVSR